jgi:hypothetical protein
MPVSGLEVTMGMGMMEKLIADSESGFMRLRSVFLGSGPVVSIVALPVSGIAINQLINKAANKKGR